MITVEILEARFSQAERSDIRFLFFDSPKRFTRHRAAAVEFSGWILGQAVSVAAIDVRVDGATVQRLPVGRARPDVAADYPNVPWAGRSGFQSLVNLIGAEREFQIELVAILEDERTVFLGTLIAQRSVLSPLFAETGELRAAMPMASEPCSRTSAKVSRGADVPDPRCSVIVPVHNQAALTRQCLDELLIGREGEPRFEVIVVNDASTDDTHAVLEAHGGTIRVVTLDPNQGFAGACNAGAAAARSEFLVFLNNDTVPCAGWLEALVAEAEAHPATGVVGAKLLYPDDTVQHAGVGFLPNGFPHHLYAGFPADHPAVNTSRPMQAVTAACCLVRRQAWEDAGGFDVAYINGWEDIDLCLRLREAGYDVRYCHQSVVYHLESASRDPRSPNELHNRELYQRRWFDRVERDSVRYYAEDGLLEIENGPLYPLVMKVSPVLAVVDMEDVNGIARVSAEHAAQTATLRMMVGKLRQQLLELTRQADEAGGTAGAGSNLQESNRAQ